MCSNARHFPGLNPLRACAAIGVMLFHAMGYAGWDRVFLPGPLILVQGGWVGLDIFFVISGFVVGQSALTGIENDGTAFRAKFVRHRLARIVPLYLLTGLVCLLAVDTAPVLGDDRILQVFSHLAFIHNFWRSTLISINPPSWSLAVEIQLYMILLLVTPWLVRQSALRVAGMAVAVALTFRTCAYFAVAMAGSNDPAIFLHAVYQTPGMLDSFGLGVAATIAVRRGSLERLGRTACIALIVVGLTGLLCTSPTITRQVIDGSIWQYPFYAITMRTWIASAALALVLGCALLPFRSDTRFGRLLDHAGDLSYGVYLWHFCVLATLSKVTSLSGWSLAGAVFVTTFAVAEVAWRLLERPVLRYAHKFDRISVPAPATVPASR
ncbi:MAG: acyltransferase [Rhodanobacter sp.]|nr:acyltransferase [Rhodanobacter sp.]